MNARRPGALAALALALTVVHLWLVDGALESRLGAGAGDARPRPIEVAFVRTLQPSAPPAVAPVAAAPLARTRPLAVPPAPAASLPALAELPPPPPDPVASAPLPAPLPDAPAAPPVLAEAAEPPALPASVQAAASSAASAASAPAFEWPPSTRLSYTLTGSYRGPVEGQARVEWVRQDTRYQVRMTVEVGPPFAPLVTRTVTSDGEIGPEGLSPRRYDEETKALLRDPRRQTIRFDDTVVRLPGGREWPRPAGVQDTASQFVQLTWLFTTRPALLEPGRTVELPLALPRYVDVWTYDVLARETLWTPFGAVDTVHVKPRREPRPGVDLTAEMWVAPTLQYLPVRILIRQDAENYVDLLVRELPLQAVPGGR